MFVENVDDRQNDYRQDDYRQDVGRRNDTLTKSLMALVPGRGGSWPTPWPRQSR
jgi:hypothetical protein